MTTTLTTDMTKNGRQCPRKLATKLPSLQKKMQAKKPTDKKR
jgi:hypothetical protein